MDYTYDSYGNRLTDTRDLHDQNPLRINNYTYDPATNRLLSIMTPGSGTQYFSYDNSGNDITGGKTYDAENRLTAIPTATESYLYDGGGYRVRKLSGATKTYYIYSSAGLLITEDNWTESTTQNQIYFNGQFLATINQIDVVRLYLKNYLGQPCTVIEISPGSNWSSNWHIVEAHDFSPFDINNGQNQDSGGLQYFYARYADGARGRWTSPDPITSRTYDPQSLNKYVYVRNDPSTL